MSADPSTRTAVATEVDESPADSPYAAADWRALGTYVQLVVADRTLLGAARAEATRILDAVDRTCSRFRDDSDLVRANRAAGSWVSVDPLLVSAVATAIEAAHETDGLVDPTLGLSLEAIGYDRDLPRVQATDGPARLPLPAVPGAWRAIEYDPTGGLRVPAGVALDLGATGKAFAADLVADRIARLVGTDLVVSLGGDVSVGRVDPAVGAEPGSATGADEPREWLVTVAEGPTDDPDETVAIERGGLATSSTVHRRWMRAGHEIHHLLDPRTGRPVRRCWRTVTVAANTCVAANTASTAAVVLGTLAPAWLTQRGLPARLVALDGTVRYYAGWPEEGN